MVNVDTIYDEVGNICTAIKNSGIVTLAVLQDDIIVVTSPFISISGNPFIALAKQVDASEAYEKYLHVLGKLVRKDGSSKYFGCPRIMEHLVNGDIDSSLYGKVGEIAKAACDAYNKRIGK